MTARLMVGPSVIVDIMRMLPFYAKQVHIADFIQLSYFSVIHS